MSAWRGTFTDLMRKRFSALVAYGMALAGDRDDARDLAQDAAIEVFSSRTSWRSVAAAERAVRDAMAQRAVDNGVDPTAAASVLIALDSMDDAAVRKALGTSAPDPVPTPDAAWVAATRKDYLANAATYAAVPGGMNAVMEPARLRHRGAVMRSMAIVVGSAVGIVALGYGAAAIGLPLLTREAAAPGPSPWVSASAVLPEVTWDDATAITAATASFDFPQCGDTWTPDVASIGGVTPEPTVTGEEFDDPSTGVVIEISEGFVSDNASPTWLLAAPYNFVVTRDHVVVMTPPEERYAGLELYLANTPPSRFRGNMGLSRQGLCDAQESAAELEATLGEFDRETATAEETAAYDAAWAEWATQWNTFEPGTYRIYQVSPMVFGEQAALGLALHNDGVEDLQLLSTAIQYTDLVEDPRIAPFCVVEGTGRNQEALCEVPPEVLAAVLTRAVDPTTVLDVEPGVGISEPLEYVVE